MVYVELGAVSQWQPREPDGSVPGNSQRPTPDGVERAEDALAAARDPRSSVHQRALLSSPCCSPRQRLRRCAFLKEKQATFARAVPSVAVNRRRRRRRQRRRQRRRRAARDTTQSRASDAARPDAVRLGGGSGRVGSRSRIGRDGDDGSQVEQQRCRAGCAAPRAAQPLCLHLQVPRGAVPAVFAAQVHLTPAVHLLPLALSEPAPAQTGPPP